MARRNLYEGDYQIRRKKSKNLLWLGIISIIMLFAGFTSAYIVIAQDTFWVAIEMPISFWISTAVIIVGSLTYYLALKDVRKENFKRTSVWLYLTLITGIAFGVLQFTGWAELVEKGNYLVGSISAEGKYGSNFTLTYEGDRIGFDGTDYYLKGEKVSEDLDQQIHELADRVLASDLQQEKMNYDFSGLSGLAISFQNRPLIPKNGGLYYEFRDSMVMLSYDQRIYLKTFAFNIKEDLGDFQMKGEYGKDYTLLWKGEELTYENRRLYLEDRELTQEEYAILNKSRNTASSFIYIITVLHFLHYLGGLIYILSTVIRAARGRLKKTSELQIENGGLYWHFLGVLWIYLFMFLSFIH